jgi:hypothetical protein
LSNDENPSEGLDASISAKRAEVIALEKLITAAKEKIKEVNSIHSQAKKLEGQIGTVNKNAGALTESGNTLKEKIASHEKLIDSANETLNKSKKLRPEITAFYNELFEDVPPEADEGGEGRTSLRTEFSDFQKKYRVDFKKLSEDLEAEIRSLLPEAGAAGLSSAYVEAKATYGYIPYGKTKSGSSYWSYVPYGIGLGFHWIKQNLPNFFNYALFLVPLFYLGTYFIDFAEGLLQVDSLDNITVKAIFLRTLASTPIIAISVFGWSSIRLRRRLYEEYNHKQRVMQLYHSFLEEVSGEGLEMHRQELLKIMLNTVADKPTLAMNQFDKDEGEGFLSNFGINKNRENEENN